MARPGGRAFEVVESRADAHQRRLQIVALGLVKVPVASDFCGLSDSEFRRSVLPHLAVIRHGRSIGVPVNELRRYLAGKLAEAEAR